MDLAPMLCSPGARRARTCLAAIAALGVFLASVRDLPAYSTGITGLSKSPTGCACHGSSPNANGAATVTISGPQTVQPGSTHTYTISVTGGPAGTKGGFNLSMESAGGIGTLIPGTGTQVSGGQLTHSNPNSRSWTFQWTAPNAGTTVHAYAVSQAVNGNLNPSGDSWNWYGGAAGTAYAITVSPLVSAHSPNGSALSLSLAGRNPFTQSAAFNFTLPTAGPVRLDVFDSMGRRVAGLAEGHYPQGLTHVVWNARDERGWPIPAGVYELRLRFADATLTRKVVRAR